jgi:hypothetical protein
MRITLLAALLFTESLLANQATTICSSEGQRVLGTMGTDKSKLEKYCAPQKTKSKVDYDLASGAQDFSELKIDTSNGKSLGKTFRAVAKYCGSPDAHGNFPTVMCLLPDNAAVYVTGSKEIRQTLSKGSNMLIEGKIVGAFVSPIIEVK